MCLHSVKDRSSMLRKIILDVVGKARELMFIFIENASVYLNYMNYEI